MEGCKADKNGQNNMFVVLERKDTDRTAKSIQGKF